MLCGAFDNYSYHHYQMYRYDIYDKSIGSGAYGVVYRALDKKTNTFVALKKYKWEGRDEGVSAATLREITSLNVLKGIKHANIVSLENVIFEDKRIHLIFELMEHDLKYVMDKSPHPFSEETVQVSYTSSFTICITMLF